MILHICSFVFLSLFMCCKPAGVIQKYIKISKMTIYICPLYTYKFGKEWKRKKGKCFSFLSCYEIFFFFFYIYICNNWKILYKSLYSFWVLCISYSFIDIYTYLYTLGLNILFILLLDRVFVSIHIKHFRDLYVML